MQNLLIFVFADGTVTGIGTQAELDQLKADGILPDEVTGRPLTDEEHHVGHRNPDFTRRSYRHSFT